MLVDEVLARAVVQRELTRTTVVRGVVRGVNFTGLRSALLDAKGRAEPCRAVGSFGPSRLTAPPLISDESRLEV